MQSERRRWPLGEAETEEETGADNVEPVHRRRGIDRSDAIAASGRSKVAHRDAATETGLVEILDDATAAEQTGGCDAGQPRERFQADPALRSLGYSERAERGVDPRLRLTGR
jgi:hypothetical protein